MHWRLKHTNPGVFEGSIIHVVCPCGGWLRVRKAWLIYGSSEHEEIFLLIIGESLHKYQNASTLMNKLENFILVTCRMDFSCQTCTTMH